MILTCPICRARSEFDRRVLFTRKARCHCGADMVRAIEAYRNDEIAEMRGTAYGEADALASDTNWFIGRRPFMIYGDHGEDPPKRKLVN